MNYLSIISVLLIRYVHDIGERIKQEDGDIVKYYVLLLVPTTSVACAILGVHIAS